jgi:hypothetical protein
VNKKKPTTYWIKLFLCVLATQTLAQNKNNCQIRIDSVYANDKIVAYNPSSIHLKPKENDVLFFLNTFQNSDSTYFFWRGVDAKPALCRAAIMRYTNITGDRDTLFIFQKKNNQLQLCFSLPVRVEYTLVENPLFYPSLLGALLSIFAAISYNWLSYSFRQKVKVNNIRIQIASDLHDEVGSTLSSISVLGKVLNKQIKDQVPEALPILDKILKSSRQTIINLRDTVWAINPENDSFEKLISKMRIFAIEMFDAEDITLHYQNDFEKNKELLALFNLSMELRRNVYLMFKEIINNIIKHANADTVHISMTEENGLIQLRISDNGKGFEWNKINDGNGLKNLHRRAADCHMNLDIQSNINQGTTITVYIPNI